MEWIVQERIDKLGRTLDKRVAKWLTPEELTDYKDSSLRVDASGRLLLSFDADHPVGDREKADLRNLGATVDMSTADIQPFRGVSLVPPDYGAIEAWIPYDHVEAAAALPWVTAVGAADMARGDAGTVVSDGVELHRADLAHAAGIDGSGVTIGVISLGAVDVNDSIGAGELPADVRLLGPEPGHGDEGTAMMEIVHDMAPGAKLLFYPSDATTLHYVVALRELAIAGADIIAEDIALDKEPAFEQGLAAYAAQMLAASGVSIQASAGNLAESHAPRVHAVGSGRGPGDHYRFANCKKPPKNVVTTFDVKIQNGDTMNATLQWSEPSHRAFTDLDLYLMNSDGCLKESLGSQGGGAGKPLEYLEYTNDSGKEESVRLVVNLADNSTAAAPPLMDLRWRNRLEKVTIEPISPYSRAGSLNPNVNFTASATSVAAADVQSSRDPSRVSLQKSSGAGPVVLENTTICPDHQYPCLKGIRGREYFKGGGPSWTAAEDVDVSAASHYPNPFIGTSAAVPHAAGCEALVRQQLKMRGIDPSLSNVQAFMSKMAISRGDRADWGSGVLICYPLED
jgi:hypothetical protein